MERLCMLLKKSLSIILCFILVFSSTFVITAVAENEENIIPVTIQSGTDYTFNGNAWKPQAYVTLSPIKPTANSKYISFDFKCSDISTVIDNFTAGSKSSIDGTGFTYNYTKDLGIYFDGTDGVSVVGVIQWDLLQAFKDNEQALSNGETVRFKFDIANEFSSTSMVSGINIMVAHSSKAANIAGINFSISNMMFETSGSSADEEEIPSGPLTGNELITKNGDKYTFSGNAWGPQLNVPVKEAAITDNKYVYLYMDIECSNIDAVISNVSISSAMGATNGAWTDGSADPLKIWFEGQSVARIGVNVNSFKSALISSRDILARGDKATLIFKLTNADLFTEESKITSINFMPTHGDRVAAIAGVEWNVSNIHFETEYVGSIKDAMPNVTVGKDETEIYITWSTSAEPKGKVKLTENGNTTVIDAYEYAPSATQANKYNNRVKITGLKPNTEYTYCVGNDDEWSDNFTFKTSDFDNNFNFVHISDVQFRSDLPSLIDNFNKTLDAINTNFPETNFILNTGDVVENDDSALEYISYLSAIREYITAVLPGNHDASEYNSLFNEYFTIPENKEFYSGIGPNAYDYWYGYNNVLFISINTNISDVDYHKNFVKSVVEAEGDKYDWKIVTSHHSLFSASYHSQEANVISLRENLAPLFSEVGIDVVLSGHDHCYDRSYIMNGTEPVVSDADSVRDADGVLYISGTTATATKYNDAVSGSEKYSAKTVSNTYGFINCEVTEESLAFTFYGSEDMSELDKFTLYKTPVSKDDKEELEDKEENDKENIPESDNKEENGNNNDNNAVIPDTDNTLDSNLPQTGENISLLIYMSFIFVCGLSVACVISLKKKQNSK